MGQFRSIDPSTSRLDRGGPLKLATRKLDIGFCKVGSLLEPL